MSLSNKPQRHELYVGTFQNSLWTIESLCDYFHQLIEGSHITDCHFYPCANLAFEDHSFAILTFDSTSSIDQCLSKRNQIKQEHRLIVKRNLRETSKDQRSPSEYILIHINQFDPSFNTKNLLAYFSKYGSLIQWKILDNGRTFLLNFKDHDSVDRIVLDKPHYLNDQSLTIRKCYDPYNVISTYSIENILKEKIRNLKAGIERTIYSNQSELIKVKKQIQEEILQEENRLSDLMKSYVRLERIQRDLQQNFIHTSQINRQLKKQLEETQQKNQRLLNDFQNQLEQQQSINKSLQESIVN